MIGPFIAILLLLALVALAIGLYFRGIASALEAAVGEFHPATYVYKNSAIGMLQIALAFGIIAGGLITLTALGVL